MRHLHALLPLIVLAACAPLPPADAPEPATMTIPVALVAETEDAEGGFPCAIATCVLVEREVPRSDDRLGAAVTALLTMGNPYFETRRLHNEFAGRNLTLRSAGIMDEVALVDLGGNFIPVGDLPVPQWQLEATVLQVPGVQQLRILLNGSEEAWAGIWDLRGPDGE